MDEPTTTRVDRWLWAVRAYRTRTDATDACRGGHVRVNGSPAKAATPVRAGDRVVIRRSGGQERDLEVVRPIERRVGAAIAATCLVDRTPPAPAGEEPPVFERDRGAGRPTKRDRRELDRFRSR